MELEQRELVYRLADTQQMINWGSLVLLVFQLVNGSGGVSRNGGTSGGGGGGGGGTTQLVLNGKTYTVTAHPRNLMDGPTGVVTLAMADTSATGRANTNNPWWNRLTGDWDFSFNNTGHAFGTNCDPVPGFLCLNSMTFPDSMTNGAHTLGIGLVAAQLWFGTGADPADNTYLPTAKWAITHFEDYGGGGFPCDETIDWCGQLQIGDYGRIYLDEVAQTYTIIRSILTPAEITTFKGKIFNDNSNVNRGLGGKDSDHMVNCVPQVLTTGTGTITISGTAITFSSAVLDSTWVGAALYGVNGVSTYSGDTIFGRILTVTDSTHGVLSRNEPTYSGAVYRYIKAWKEDTGGGIGNCGIIWKLKHSLDNVSWDAPNLPDATYATAYPPSSGAASAGTNYDPGYGNWTSGTPDARRISMGDNNKTWSEVDGFMSISFALLGDDTRANDFLIQVWNFYYKWMLPVIKSIDTGFAASGAAYSSGRGHSLAASMATMICNNLGYGSLPCQQTLGVHITNILPYYLYMTKVGDISNGTGMPIDTWGSEIGANEKDTIRGSCFAASLVGNTTNMAKWQYYHQLQTLSQDRNSWQDPMTYLGCDPNRAQVDPQTAAPRQFAFMQNDYTYCLANADWTGESNCHINSSFTHIVSQTGFGANDTRMLISGAGSGEPQQLDHANSLDIGGHFQIQKGGSTTTSNQYLLGFDNLQSATDNGVRGYAYNTIELGDDSYYWWKPDFLHVGHTETTRWGGVIPTGPATNDYSYTFIDMLPASTVSASFVPIWTSSAGPITNQRQIIHSKPSGAQDFIVCYDYANTSISETLRSYWHYWLTTLNTRTGFSYNGTTRVATMIHSGDTAEILSKFFPVAGINTIALLADNSDGSWTPSNNYTSRVYVCASTDGSTCINSTSYESLAIHMPVLSTSATLPTLTQITATATGGNATVLQIQDSTTPQVMSFARQGSLLSVEGFTSTFTGSNPGLYVITGFATGTYAVTVGGTPVSGSPFNVNQGDTTIRFTAGAGVVAIN